MNTRRQFGNLAAILLTGLVIALGAYTRLKDAGLGCPDWPGCYGRLLAPSIQEVSIIEPIKAWIEMVHRYVAGCLGFLVLGLVVVNVRRVRVDHITAGLSIILLFLLVCQGLLGMWTVTLRLYPVVVMAHLLGGISILALLWVLYLRNSAWLTVMKTTYDIRWYTCLASAAVLAVIVQIALGGWTSANYAALVCSDFPTCQGVLWPEMDWQGAFNFTGVGIFDSPGIPLENAARVTIQVAHRCGAVVVAVLCGWLGFLLIRYSGNARKAGWLLWGLIFFQISLGIINILARLPLWSSVLHNLCAASLLLTVIYILMKSVKREHG